MMPWESYDPKNYYTIKGNVISTTENTLITTEHKAPLEKKKDTIFVRTEYSLIGSEDDNEFLTDDNEFAFNYHSGLYDI